MLLMAGNRTLRLCSRSKSVKYGKQHSVGGLRNTTIVARNSRDDRLLRDQDRRQRIPHPSIRLSRLRRPWECVDRYWARQRLRENRKLRRVGGREGSHLHLSYA